MPDSDRVETALAHYASIGHARSVPVDPVPADYPGEVEAALGIVLPHDYRRFLATYPCTGGPTAVVLSPLIGDQSGASASILEFQACATDRSDLIGRNRPSDDFHIPDMLIIGDDAFGNPFYLDLATNEVWFCDRVDGIPGQRAGLALVGTDFADFLLRMAVAPDGDLQPELRRPTMWSRLRDWITP